MITAIVFVHADVARIPEVAQQIAEIERRLSESNEQPRRRYVSPATREEAYALYYDRLRRRIEDRGTKQGTSEVAVGNSLRIRLPSGSFRIRAAAKEQELLVTIPLREGKAQLVLDYVSQEAK